ncbi:MAG: hypothetical protein J6Y24_11885 [Bacteroidales bacterium]|nr:hypothetical protein [Bacteroidales bacterium]MBP5503478.1 hypothetical protein [Bacteroidales bacterium]
MLSNTKIALSQQETSLVDVLWNLYILQNDKVKEAFRMLLDTKEISESNDEITKNQQKMVKESFTRAYDELVSGKVKHNARNLFVD